MFANLAHPFRHRVPVALAAGGVKQLDVSVGLDGILVAHEGQQLALARARARACVCGFVPRQSNSHSWWAASTGEASGGEASPRGLLKSQTVKKAGAACLYGETQEEARTRASTVVIEGVAGQPRVIGDNVPLQPIVSPAGCGWGALPERRAPQLTGQVVCNVAADRETGGDD